MKQNKLFLFAVLVIVAVATLASCEKRNIDAGEGFTEFSIMIPADFPGLKSAELTDSTNSTWQLMISVEDAVGKTVFADKLIPLYTFGTGYVSEKVEIPSGELRLTKFMVINTTGNVIYATPLAGSPLAYLISKPLPLNFSVTPGEVTQIVPEVLQVGDLTPDKFGYAAFGVSIVKPLVFYTGAVIDNPMIMAPFPLWTEAKLTVWAGSSFIKDSWHYSFHLVPGVNRIVVRGGFDYYSFIVEKEGFIPQKFVFKAGELAASAKDNPIYLRIPWDAVVYNTFVLQPGPEDGKDAVISNLEPDKNFGAHRYFEATFISEPVLTVMRLNRSLIHFRMPQTYAPIFIKKVILRLSYEVPIPWDSTIYAGLSENKFVGGVLQQVIEPWDENGVTWNKAPETIEHNQVFIAPFNKNANFIDIDVTRLYVQPAGTDPAVYPNHGMLFKLVPEDLWKGFRFASSDHPNAYLRPRLTVYYTNK